jgi:hypothetical protein
MAKVQSATELKEYAYRRLGYPKVEIQVDDTQAMDRIDDAVQLFIERHFDGVEEKYITITFDATDEANQYITMPDDVIAVTRIYEPGRYSSEAMSDVRYKIMFDQMFDMTKVSMQYYEMTMQNLSMISDYFNPDRTFTFNKANNRLYSHSGTILGPSCKVKGVCSVVAHTTETDCVAAAATWTAYDTETKCTTAGSLWYEGSVMMLRGFVGLHPDESTGYAIDVYNDEWMKKYTTALIKKQWGSNMKQYDGMPLPGGIVVNGQQLFDEANEEILRLEEQFSLEYEMPTNFLVG